MLADRYVTAIVVARKGSRRVPGKYLRVIAGEPMILRKVRQLTAVPGVDEILVGTDDDEMPARLAAIADPRIRHYRRPDRLCDERSATPNDMIRDMCGQAKPGAVLWAHPTNPLCGTEEYGWALGLYLAGLAAGKADSVYSATEIRCHAWFEGRPLNHAPQAAVHIPAAGLEPVYLQNGAIFIRDRDAMLADGRFIGDAPAMYTMDPVRGWDIDEEWQLDVARLLERGAAPCDP